MKLKNVMSTEIHAVSKGASVKEAARVMEIFNLSFLPVISEGKPIGTVTAGDLVTRVVAPGLDPKRTLISEVMDREPIGVYEDETLEDVELMMRNNRLSRLLVLGYDGTLTGIFTLSDLATNDRESGEVLRQIFAICRESPIETALNHAFTS